MSRLPSKDSLARLVLLLVIAAAHLGITATGARAQETLRVGRAIANSWSFVPLDVGMAAGIFAKHGLVIESVSFTGSARLQQGMAAQSIDIGLSAGDRGRRHRAVAAHDHHGAGRRTDPPSPGPARQAHRRFHGGFVDRMAHPGIVAPGRLGT